MMHQLSIKASTTSTFSTSGIASISRAAWSCKNSLFVNNHIYSLRQTHSIANKIFTHSPEQLCGHSRVRILTLPRFRPNLSQLQTRFVSYTPEWNSNGNFNDSTSPYNSQQFNSQFAPKHTPINTVIMFVPEREAWVVERMGKFTRVLEPGLAVLIPFIDTVRYVQSLKEVAMAVPSQSAITADNVQISMDGVLYYKVVDPFKASYGVENSEYAVAQLAQTTMRAEIGQMTLDRTLAERAHLNANITDVINAAAEDWGIKVLRYEIRDIHPPANVIESMHSQVSAERSKRAMTLESEGHRQAAINKAAGESEAILLKAKATAEGIQRVAQSINDSKNAGQDAVALSVSTQYMEAFGKLAKEGNTVIVPASLNDPSAFITQALSIYKNVSGQAAKQEQVKTTN